MRNNQREFILNNQRAMMKPGHALKDKNSKTRIAYRELIIISVILLLFLGMFLYLNSVSKNLLWDETVYLGNSRSHISVSNYTEDFRYPLIEWMIAFIWLFTGESIFAAKIFVMLLTILTILLFYTVSKRYMQEYLAIIAAIIFGTSPLMLFWGYRIYTDIPSLFFMMLSFYFILIYHEANIKRKRSNRPKNARNIIGAFWIVLIAGIFSGMAFLTRFTQGLFIVAAGIYIAGIALHNKDMRAGIKTLSAYAAGILITLIPWMTYNYIHYKNLFWDFIAQYTLVNQWTSWEPAMQQVQNLFLYNSFLIVILFVAGLVFLAYKKPRLWILMLAYVVLSLIVYLFVLRLKDARYYISILPFIYLAAFYALEKIFEYMKSPKIRWKNGFFRRIDIIHAIPAIIIAVIILTCAGLSYIQYQHIQEMHSCEDNSLMSSVGYLSQKNLTGDSVIISNAWTWYGYLLNVHVASMWSNDFNYMIGLYHPKYIIYNDMSPSEEQKQLLDANTHIGLEKTFNGACNDKTYVYSVKE